MIIPLTDANRSSSTQAEVALDLHNKQLRLCIHGLGILKRMAFRLEPRSSHPEAPVLDWSTTPLSGDYEGCYAKIIDDVLTPEECASLIALAESDKEWTPAFVNYGMGPNDKYIDTSYRNSERILRFDEEAAEQIYQRLLPYVPELVEIKPGDRWRGVVESFGGPETGVWKLIGVNERLSFLRYGPGQFFAEHVDTHVELKDGRKSRVTIQLYLGDSGVEGGPTRIRDRNGRRYIDVEPKPGRVLIFQQYPIWHTGEKVVKGTKYSMRSDFMFVQTDE